MMKRVFAAGVALLLAVGVFVPTCPGADTVSAVDEEFLKAAEDIRCLLIPGDSTVLSSEIAAEISAMNVDMGGVFTAGQELVLLDTAIYQAQAQRVAAEFEAAEKSLEIQRSLSEMGSGSEMEMVAAEARLAAARAELNLSRIQVDLGTIRAPYDGRVVSRLANTHEYVTQGQPLLDIIDDTLKLQLHVPSRWLRWLSPGIGFEVQVDETGKTYPARITRLGARVDPVSQTIEVRAGIEGRFPELLAGMSGICRFTLPSEGE